MDPVLDCVIEKIAPLKPVSIFLYGSRARADFLKRSDYEIGILYRETQEISPVQLKALIGLPEVNAYLFKYEDFVAYNIDTPFPETIYLRELIQGGKTIWGEEVIEKMTPQPITLIDLLERVNFDTAWALAAVLSQRQGDAITASLEFSKSCLFGIRNLIILKEKIFPMTYDDIYAAVKKLNLEAKYNEVIDHAFAVRKGAIPEEVMLYRNISMLNRVVKAAIKTAMKDANSDPVLD